MKPNLSTCYVGNMHQLLTWDHLRPGQGPPSHKVLKELGVYLGISSPMCNVNVYVMAILTNLLGRSE
jgi:hypothetical protein